MDELWKKIKGFDYEVSNLGNVRSLAREITYRNFKGRKVSYFKPERILTPVKLKNGYYAVILRKNGISYCKYIHRLVATYFVDNPLDLPVINHIDRNRRNNRWDNLEWCTTEYNVQYSVAHPVCQYTLDGKFIQKYPSMLKAEEALGLSNDSIRPAIARGGTSGGYRWVLEHELEDCD